MSALYESDEQVQAESPPTASGTYPNRPMKFANGGVGQHSSTVESSTEVWSAIRSLPGVKSWRIVNDALFLATSFPIALVAFVLAVVGGAVGASLVVLVIGLPILVWTIGLLLRIAGYERERLHAFLGLNLQPPRYPRDQGTNVGKHLLHVIRTPQIWRDIGYLLILFPVSIVQLAIVLLPLQLFLPAFWYFAFGSLSPLTAFGISVDTTLAATMSFGLGVMSLIPVWILITIAANLHRKFAVHFLQSQ